tara:strand:+ start:325 stop:645 length:321 start_codon:yes stop_codon:yes gene_type:complete
MTAVNTAAHTVLATSADTGEVKEITIRVPVGPIVEPSEEAKGVFNGLVNPENWKAATRVFNTDSADRAAMVADVLDFYTGGHEMSTTGPDAEYMVWSKGYYAYIGA